MCDQTEVNYADGEIVWVKLGSCFWPGEVVGTEKLSADFLSSFKKPPIAVVKFFQEDTYEYVKNAAAIYKYECSRKNEFIQKGLYIYRRKHGTMEKFPDDVIRAETAVGGDTEILSRDEFQEAKKESYADLFTDPKRKISPSGKKGRSGKSRSLSQSNFSTPIKKMKDKTNYQVHILLQGSKTPNPSEETTPSTSRAGTEPPEEMLKEPNNESPKPISNSTPTLSSSGIYACPSCPFSTSRLNVLILHNKTHSFTFTPYIPTPKKLLKSIKSAKSSLVTKPTQSRKPRQDKVDKEPVKKVEKREAEEKNGIDNEPKVKKSKIDEEIKSSLLADWDDGDEESNEEQTIATARSPDVPVAAGSPAVPISAELPSDQVPFECELKQITDTKKDANLPIVKPESSNDAKYDFCEDEDWPEEADVGRKIPRITPLKRKEDTKSVSIDEIEVAREVAELLNKTTVPELPSAPEPLKVEENFPEPSIIKSPDKKSEITSRLNDTLEKNIDGEEVKPQKPIFKTKTFFRSRHSRSQDAIGKYVAEQLNAGERLDMLDKEMNGSEMLPSLELRVSPVDNAKVVRLAPKIQLKKMNAEAQLKEKERFETEKLHSDIYKENLDGENLVIECTKKNDTAERILAGSNDVSTDSNKDISPEPTLHNEIYKNTIQLLNDKEISDDVEKSVQENLLSSPDKQNTRENIDSAPKTIVTPYESFMNESTASAVDALLSVSREADRVTKVISIDPPEDLFEDDNKDSTPLDVNISGRTLNGISNEIPGHEISEISNIKHEHLNSTIEIDTSLQISDPDQSKTDLQNDDLLKTDITVASKQLVSEEILFDVNMEHHESEDILSKQDNTTLDIISNIPSESDLQIAETLINLPSTNVQNKVSIPNPDEIESSVDIKDATTEELIKNDTVCKSNIEIPETIIEDTNLISNSSILAKDNRFESEEEASENLNAAQSLVQMSESVEHKINVADSMTSPCKDQTGSHLPKSTRKEGYAEKPKLLNASIKENDILNGNTGTIETRPKVLKLLEGPSTSRVTITNNAILKKKVIVPTKEKILNSNVNKSVIKSNEAAKQQIIIRRTTPNRLLNNVTDVTTADKIILSRTNKASADGSAVQSYTIQTESNVQTDKSTNIIQPKIRKISKPSPKLQKIRPQTTAVPTIINKKLPNEVMKQAGSVFDINSLPVVLSDDVLTPESIENMPIVMSDGNIITSLASNKVGRSKKIIRSEKITVTSSSNKQDFKGVSSHATHDVNKLTTPNILSKSSKLRSPKPMLIIDKSMGKQKLIMTKSDLPAKEVKQQNKLIVPSQGGSNTSKYVILPKPSSPRPGRTQKIVINPQTGKAHVVVEKGPTSAPASENKPVSAKLIAAAADSKSPGNTVMIITNAQGTQSRIVLTSEHEKILFPNKQQPSISQLKPIMQKSVVTSAAAAKSPTRIVSKQQKSAIITSKGQLIVGGRIATTTQNIAPLPEIRPATKRLPEPKKLTSVVQKPAAESLIFLQKSGSVMQLTASQFEHLQRTGQIIQKMPQENKVIVQKTITMAPTEILVPAQKQRARKHPHTESAAPMKKIKHDITIGPATPVLVPAVPTPTPNPTLFPMPLPALTPICPVPTNQSVTAYESLPNSNAVSTLENFEEFLSTTAIARPTESVLSQPEEQPQDAAAPLPDSQLLAVPGEHFGGPLGSFYLCVEDNGTFTAIDNRPLVLENNQLVPMPPEAVPAATAQPERIDILEAALANSDVFHAESIREEAPDFRDLNANVSVHCRVSETSTTLNQPIMTPVEVPTNADSEPAIPTNLEDGLAVIGVTPHTVPTSLELPITVTDPRIAPKTTDPLSSSNYRPPLLSSPRTDLAFAVGEGPGPISMPSLREEEAVGKSMPILIDEIAERTISSVESAADSPSSVDIRESETDDGSQWTRRLLTPGSDISEASVEIPLQPSIQLSVSDLSHNT